MGRSKATEPALEPGHEKGAAARLMPLVLGELRSLAAHHLRRERKDHTLQPTELVHEAYLKLADQAPDRWQGRTHFFAVAASAVREVLVEHARRRHALKRGEGRRTVTLFEGARATDGLPAMEILDLDQALVELEKLDARQKQVVELRFFGGLTIEEIAAVMKVSPRTVKGIWRIARAWLIVRMGA